MSTSNADLKRFWEGSSAARPLECWRELWSHTRTGLDVAKALFGVSDQVAGIIVVALMFSTRMER